jgi:hypothetical protein
MAENQQAPDDKQDVIQEPTATKRKRKIDGNLLMSFAAIFLSAGTLFILIYQSNLISKQFELQQKQQYASVMPYLMVSIGNSDDEGYELFIINQGLGPAFIEEVNIHYKDTVFRDHDFFSAYSLLKEQSPNIGTINFFGNIFKGRVLAANEHIVHLSMATPDSLNAEIIRDGVAQMEIVYKSIYDEKWRVMGLSDIPEKVEAGND